MTTFLIKIPPLKKSCYNNEVRYYIDNFYVEPVHFGGEFKGKWKYNLGVDYPKSYSNAVIKYFKNVKLGILNVCDNFVKDDFIIKSVDENKLYLIDSVCV